MSTTAVKHTEITAARQTLTRAQVSVERVTAAIAAGTTAPLRWLEVYPLLTIPQLVQLSGATAAAIERSLRADTSGTYYEQRVQLKRRGRPPRLITLGQRRAADETTMARNAAVVAALLTILPTLQSPTSAAVPPVTPPAARVPRPAASPVVPPTPAGRPSSAATAPTPAPVAVPVPTTSWELGEIDRALLEAARALSNTVPPLAISPWSIAATSPPAIRANDIAQLAGVTDATDDEDYPDPWDEIVRETMRILPVPPPPPWLTSDEQRQWLETLADGLIKHCESEKKPIAPLPVFHYEQTRYAPPEFLHFWLSDLIRWTYFLHQRPCLSVKKLIDLWFAYRRVVFVMFIKLVTLITAIACIIAVIVGRLYGTNISM